MSAPPQPTGLLSFDVPNFLAPVNRSLILLQQKLLEEKLDLLDILQKDPVPQFTVEQIAEATTFLQGAMGAMNCFLDQFKLEAAKEASNAQLKLLLEKARESSRQLTLLFGDSVAAFSNKKEEGELLKFQEDSQSAEVRQRLENLKKFLDTFGNAAWLGQLLETPDFQKLKLVTELLGGLLSPQKKKCAGADTSAEVQRINSAISNTSGFAPERSEHWQRLSSRASQHPYQRAINNSYSNSYSYGYRRQEPQPQPQPQVDNPLAAVEQQHANAKSFSEQLRCLKEMCNALVLIDQADGARRSELKSQLELKMRALKRLAETLNRVPSVLNQYLLLRLCDVDAKDLKVLKGWVTYEEATDAHRRLEAFRDEAIYERAARPRDR